MKSPIRIGIIGMGGFAAWHHNTIAKLEERGLAKLICTCDPNMAGFLADQQTWRFAARGVGVFSNYRSMLEACGTQLDLVVVPTPINLHAEMHQACVELGIPVYLEKPPTLDYLELEEMIERDKLARKASLVGFNFIIEKARRALKERVLSGEFGAVQGVTLAALWPRPADYFKRNNWAGRLMMDGRVVLDSCLGNALAHFVHNILFWAGHPGVSSWGQLAAVRAELYRAHEIEGADTFFIEADTTQGISLRFALSHACSGPSTHCETLICEKAEIRYIVGQDTEIRWSDGRVERLLTEPFDGLMDNHLEYHAYLRGEMDRPATYLVDARPFVHLNNLAHVSSGVISPFPPELVTGLREEKEQKDYINVAGMQNAVTNFIAHGTWPSATGWSRPPGTVVTTADLPRFRDTVLSLLRK